METKRKLKQKEKKAKKANKGNKDKPVAPAKPVSPPPKDPAKKPVQETKPAKPAAAPAEKKRPHQEKSLVPSLHVAIGCYDGLVWLYENQKLDSPSMDKAWTFRHHKVSEVTYDLRRG